MRIAFLDTIDHSYTIATAHEQPLGGTASAVCYLTGLLSGDQQHQNETQKLCLPLQQIYSIALLLTVYQRFDICRYNLL